METRTKWEPLRRTALADIRGDRMSFPMGKTVRYICIVGTAPRRRNVVDRHTFIVGKTGSGKTYRSYRLLEAHQGPAIFCDFEWTKGVADFDFETTDVDEVVDVLRDTKPGGDVRIRWLLDDYGDDFGDLVEYLKDVHRGWHLRDRPLPKLALFMDEVHRIAPTWADARNPGVRVFTEGRHHNLFGVGVTQWPAQTSRLIGMNAYDWYVYFLNPKELATLSQYYHMDVPDIGWLSIDGHTYFRYSSDGGTWWRGSSTGVETSEVSQVLRPSGDVLPAGIDEGQPTVGKPADVPVPKVWDGLPVDAERDAD